MKSKKKKRRMRKLLGAGLLGMAALIALALGCAATLGIPHALSSRFLARFDPPHFTIEIGRLRWQPGRGIIAHDVRLYRKFAVGPPAVQIDKARATIAPGAWIGGGSLLQSVQVNHARINPKMLEDIERVRPPRPLPVSLVFDLVVDRAEAFDMLFSPMRFQVELHEKNVLFNEGHAVVQHGQRQGTLSAARLAVNRRERTLSFYAETKTDPRMLVPVTEHFGLEHATELAQDFQFDSPLPLAGVKLRARLGEEKFARTTIRFELGEGKFRNVAISGAEGSVHVENLHPDVLVAMDPLLVRQGKKDAAGKFAVNTRKSTVNFSLRSSLSPPALLRMIGLVDSEQDAPWDKIRFGATNRIDAAGTIHYENMGKSRMNAAVAGHGLGYDKFAMDEHSFVMSMNGRTGTVENLTGTMDEGNLTGSCQWIAPGDDRQNPRYALALKYDDASFEKLVQRVKPDGKQEYKGRFSLQLELEGETGPDARNLAHGKGQVRIQKGRVLMLPVFGGLTATLSRHIPGIDFLSRQDYAVSDFTVGDGKVKTDKAKIEGSVFRILGQGHYALDGKLDFRIQIRFLREAHILRRLLDAPTWALSKFFEFQLQGTPDNPEWTPFGPTMDLLKRIGIRD